MVRAEGVGVKVSEAAFQAQVIALARLCGWLVHHSRPALRRSGRVSTPVAGDVGLPDLVLARGGVVLFVELKAEAGRVAPAQRAWARAITGAQVVPEGVVVWAAGRRVGYVLARPSHFEVQHSVLRRGAVGDE